MKSKNFWSGLAAATGMLVLILDAQTALEGARAGIELCLKTLIPSLFPFFVLSVCMTGNLSGLNLKILRPIGKLCGIPEGAESLLVTGFLGGYPVGAQSIALSYERGTLSRPDAERLLGFCNNAGPAFLFGIAAQAFTSRWVPWALWLIHIAGALAVGILTKTGYTSQPVRPGPGTVTLTQALQKALAVMAQVCGWVLLFRTLLHYLEKWFLWLLPKEIKIIIGGLLELSNGCVQLRLLESEGLRFLVSSALLAFGGLCVTLQTCSVTGGLSLKHYFPGKLLQTSVSILMAAAAQLLLPDGQRCAFFVPIFICALLSTLILICFLRKSEKNSSIPVSVGV